MALHCTPDSTVASYLGQRSRRQKGRVGAGVGLRRDGHLWRGLSMERSCSGMRQGVGALSHFEATAHIKTMQQTCDTCGAAGSGTGKGTGGARGTGA